MKLTLLTCLLVSLSVCISCTSGSGAASTPCQVLIGTFNSHTEAFRDKVTAISTASKSWPGGKAIMKSGHVSPYMKRWDRSMLPVLIERRDFIEGTLWADRTAAQSINGCKGPDLIHLRIGVLEQLLSLNGQIKHLRTELGIPDPDDK